MERSLNYWWEAADDPAVAAILAETDPEDPDLSSEGSEEGDSDESEDDSGSASLSTPEVSDDQEEP